MQTTPKKKKQMRKISDLNENSLTITFVMLHLFYFIFFFVKYYFQKIVLLLSPEFIHLNTFLLFVIVHLSLVFFFIK